MRQTHTVSMEPKVGQRPPNNYQAKMPWYYEPYFGPYQPLAFATAKTCAKSLAYSLNIGDMWSKKPPEGVPISKASPANLEKDTCVSCLSRASLVLASSCLAEMSATLSIWANSHPWE